MANKTGLIVGVAAAVAGLLLLTRKKTAPPDDTGGDPGDGVLDVAIYDDQGNRVMSSGPISASVEAWDPGTGGTLAEGGTYTLTFSIKNSSTRAGEPWAASFQVLRIVGVDGNMLINENILLDLAAGATSAVQSKTFKIPVGGVNGIISVSVVPAGGSALIARFEKPFTVGVVNIVYGATIIITPI